MKSASVKMKITEIMQMVINKVHMNIKCDLIKDNCVHILFNEKANSDILFINPWNERHIGSFRSLTNFDDVVLNPKLIGICIDNNADLALSASICGIFAINFCYHTPVSETKISKIDEEICTIRISLIGHDFQKLLIILDILITTISFSNKAVASTELDSIKIFEKLPDRVFIARGSFWEQTHIEVRNGFVSACRLIKQSHVNIDPLDGIVSDEIDNLLKHPVHHQSLRRSSIECESVYKCDDNSIDENHEKIVLLPSMRFPAPNIATWLSDKERLYPIVFEYVASAIERNRFILTVPCGFTVDKLPMSLQISASRKRIADAIVLAQWYRSLTNWPTNPS